MRPSLIREKVIIDNIQITYTCNFNNRPLSHTSHICFNIRLFNPTNVILLYDSPNAWRKDLLPNDENGYKDISKLRKKDENLENINKFRKTTKNNEDYVDTYLREDILPGFLWIIPIKDSLYRIGLFSNDSHKKQDLILNNFLNDNFDYEIKEKYKGFIPIFDEKNKMVDRRGVLIGDAAAQVKPTSGGGLLIAFDACKIAVEHIYEAINKDNIEYLIKYQDEFFDKYLKEFKYQFKVHNTLNMLSNEDLDYLFIKLKENNCEELISTYGDIDNQSVLIKEFIKRGLILKIIPKFLFRKVAKIFRF